MALRHTMQSHTKDILPKTVSYSVGNSETEWSYQRYVKRSDSESCQFEHVGDSHLNEPINLCATIWPILVTLDLYINKTTLVQSA